MIRALKNSVLCILASPCAFAYHPHPVGLARVADGLLGITSYLNGMLLGVALLAGIACLIVSVIDLKRHFQNPIEVTGGRVFFSFIMGLALCLLAFIPQMKDPGPIITPTNQITETQGP
jgi:hypothetical protein